MEKIFESTNLIINYLLLLIYLFLISVQELAKTIRAHFCNNVI